MSIHNPPCSIESRVAEDVAEVSDLRACRRSARRARAGSLRPRREARLRGVRETRASAASNSRREPGCPALTHRGGCGDQAWMLCGLGKHFIEAVNLRQHRAAVVEVACDPRVERAGQLEPLLRPIGRAQKRRERQEPCCGITAQRTPARRYRRGIPSWLRSWPEICAFNSMQEIGSPFQRTSPSLVTKMFGLASDSGEHAARAITRIVASAPSICVGDPYFFRAFRAA